MRITVIALTLLLSFVIAKPALAQDKPLGKLDVNALIKAAKISRQYQALTNNPEVLKALMRIAESIKNKQGNK